ncbi:1314_t:CDS:2, partial [Cetraspora pellucida]
GSVSYLVKWRGYPDEENSWKLQDEIIKYAELLEYYWEHFDSHPTKSTPKEIPTTTTDSTLSSKSIVEANSSKIVDKSNSKTVNVKKKQNESNKMDNNSEKNHLGDNIPRFYEPDWDSHVECIETIYRDECSKDILAIIKWKSHKLRTLHSIEEVKRRCPQQVIKYYETNSRFKDH